MMKDYKRIGDFISRISDRNREGTYSKLLGINIDNFFMPSIINRVGVNLKNYKIVKQYQFACNRMHVGRDYRIPIAMSNSIKPFIVSPAYDVFEVTKPEVLMPEYLMLWFKRKEYDRNAWFHTDGDVRGGLPWEAFCDIKINIPSIEKQRKIVAEYQAVENKIKTNEQICEKIEAAAQALYKHWFIDFEFPNEEDMPYKSSGGAMVYNEELEKEIPKGWEATQFTKVVKLTGGGTPKTTKLEYWNGDIPFFTPADISGRYYSVKTIKNITELGLKNSSTKLYPKNTIFITARGTVGAISLSSSSMAMNQSCYAIKNDNPFYTHQLTLSIINELKSQAVGAVFNALVTRNFEQFYVCNPDSSLKTSFDEFVSSKYEIILKLINQNQKLQQFQALLLGRMTFKEMEVKY